MASESTSPNPSGTEAEPQLEKQYWLMKAEPDSRVVKGKDVKFSVDDFEAAGYVQSCIRILVYRLPVRTTAWEGVRSYEARNIMRDKMKVGDKVLFYHSNCKNPGIAALAEVCKEAYPDHTAWDASHPYYDAKTDKDDPRWYMVDVRFLHRVQHFVPLAVLKTLDAHELEYLRDEHKAAVKSMALINKGRLSVQPVSQLAYEAITIMGERGGFATEGKAKRKRAEKGDDEEAGRVTRQRRKR